MQSNEMKDIKMEGNSIEIINAVPETTAMGENKTRNSIGLEAAIMMPPPPVQNVVTSVTLESRPPSSAASDKDDDEVLSLQVLSARSSTPYTVQALCCNNANCELGTTDSTTVSPVKEEQPVQVVADENKNGVEEESKEQHLIGDVAEKKFYSRSELMNIRDEMISIVRPECLTNTSLRRLNLGKTENVPVGRNKHFRSSNPPNDLMPAFFKRKAAISNGNGNSITYDNFKYTDTNPFVNQNDGAPSHSHRRIGSGRLSNRDINWDYIPEEDPEKDNLPEFFTTKEAAGSNGKPQRHAKKYEHDDNSNYVKRVINSVVGESSYRGSKISNNSSSEERYSTNSSGTNNKNEEPEWFSCGPTSQLDTIELCGFNESDQQQIRMELENSKSKSDANNNNEAPTTNGGHKEKKHLAFQFDDFSTHSAKNNTGGSSSGSASSGGNRMSSSKFMPLFNAKNKNEEKVVNQNSSQSVSDFFKRSEIPPAQKEKLSLTAIPSVDEIEAKWRTQQQHTEPKNKHNTENIRNSSENFRKMLNQLNQQQINGGVSVSPPPQQPQQTSQPVLNLFNNENLSNFIKQRNMQQMFQKQQQQAAFAQLQMTAILSRPDTQMMLLALLRGEISKNGLFVQLSNPNLTQADRDAITTVLAFSPAVQYPHQPLNINSSHHQQQQQQQFITNQLQNLAALQQLNKNTVTKRNIVGGGAFQANGIAGVGGGGGSNARTFYSQEDLQSHTNYILHNAVMKKKLEEQSNLGVQKILQLQNSMLNNSYNNNNNNSRGNDSLTGSKNQQQLQSQQIQQQKNSNAGGRGNPIGRRRSTSSSSSNATVNTSQMKRASDLEFRQLEQRRNTIAATTVVGDEYIPISQRI